jgi:hypothetical protein
MSVFMSREEYLASLFMPSLSLSDMAAGADRQVGLLPVPHPIVIRKYQANQYTSLWFTAFLWGVIFLRNQRTSHKKERNRLEALISVTTHA